MHNVLENQWNASVIQRGKLYIIKLYVFQYVIFRHNCDKRHNGIVRCLHFDAHGRSLSTIATYTDLRLDYFDNWNTIECAVVGEVIFPRWGHSL